MSDVLIGEGAEVDYAESLRWYAERSKQAAEGFEAEFAHCTRGDCGNSRPLSVLR